MDRNRCKQRNPHRRPPFRAKQAVGRRRRIAPFHRDSTRGRALAAVRARARFETAESGSPTRRRERRYTARGALTRCSTGQHGKPRRDSGSVTYPLHSAITYRAILTCYSEFLESGGRRGTSARIEGRLGCNTMTKLSGERPSDLGELRRSAAFAENQIANRSVKDELRANLICRLQTREPLFPGIVGFEDTVVPQIVNAILSRHNFILLGLRGQAKTRLIRMLTELLDAAMPVHRRLRNSRQSVQADLPPLPRSDRGNGRRDADRLADAPTSATWKSSPRPT